MKKYESYKESGIEWIGAIPEHWESTRLKFVGESIIGIIYSPDDVVNQGEGILVLRSSNIQYGKLAFEDCVFVDKEVNEKHLTKEGDILLCARNGSAHLVGKAAYIDKENEGVTFGAFMSIVRSELDKYLFYFFNSQIFKAQTGLFSTSTINQLTSDTLNNMFISFPKKEIEQSAIAHYLDRKTAEIDELIADKKRLLDLYEEEKTAIINQAVTKGINPNVTMKDSGIEWLGEIPEHWESVSLKWVSKIYSGGTPSKNNEDFWQNGTIPWLNSGTVNQFFITEPSEYITEDALNNSSAKWIPANSIVIALAGQGKTKGMAAQVMFECTCNQSMGVIVPNNKVESRFLLYYLTRNYQNIRNLGGGDKRDGINLEMVGGIPLPILPLSEQREIVSHIENHFKILEAKKSKTEKLIELLTEYRTALISEVVTGKIKVID
jgi:type I restriction enzyme S subunit